MRLVLAVLALWLQALAPVLAAHTVLRAADPLAGAVFCGRSPAAGTDAHERATPAAECPSCPSCCTAATALPDPPGPVGQRLSWIAVRWPVPPPPAAGALRHVAAQARAPPGPL